MQVENPEDIVCAFASQIIWLERKLEKLKRAGLETDPVYARVVGELAWCRTAHDRIKGIIAEPKGYWVLVLRSKAPGLQGKVGRVTYVNTKHNFASVLFHGEAKARNLGMSKLQVVSLPPVSEKIPAAGMVVKFKDDQEDYLSFVWNSEKVFVEPMSSVHKGGNPDEWNRFVQRKWRSRHDIETINGLVPI